MKSFEDFSLREESEYSKFDSLVRAGLANKAQLQRIHSILEKLKENENPNLSRSDRAIMVNLFNKMLDLITNDKSIFQKARQAVREEIDINESSNRDELRHLPPILILKRKAIRLFPNGVKVATYYSDKLNRTFALPMTDLNLSGITEEVQIDSTQKGGVIKSLREIIKGKAANTVQFKDGKKMKVDMYSAKAVLTLYDGIDSENKTKLDQLLNKDKHGFIKVVDFAFSKMKK